VKHKITLLICLALLLGAIPVTAQEPPFPAPAQTEPFPLYRTTLPNGLRLWVQPRPDSESVAALLVVHAGSRYETLSNNGVSHFVEHMLFTGKVGPLWLDHQHPRHPWLWLRARP